MTVKLCPICHETINGDAVAHPSCVREHPEFDLTPVRELVATELKAKPKATVTDLVTRESVPTDELMKMIAKQFGENAMLRGSAVKPIEYRGSGSYALDIALGGGYPKGRVIDVLGKEGHGKTLVVELAIIEAQRTEGLRSVLFDLEGTWEKSRFVALGGDPDMLDVVRAENVEDRGMPLLFGETAFEMANIILRYSDTHAIVAFDSTGAMVSKAEYEIKEESMEKQTMSHTARLMSAALRVSIGSGILARSKNSMNMFFISQSRDNIGGRAIRGIPPPDKHTGGRALRFYGSVRIEVSKGDILRGDLDDERTGRKDANIEVGHVTKVRVRKNKANRFQGRIAEFDIYTEGDVCGIDRVQELLKLALYCNVIKQGGKYLTILGRTDSRIEGSKAKSGKDIVTDMLREDTVLFMEVEAAVKKQLAVMMDASAQPETEEEAYADEIDDNANEPILEP